MLVFSEFLVGSTPAKVKSPLCQQEEVILCLVHLIGLFASPGSSCVCVTGLIYNRKLQVVCRRANYKGCVSDTGLVRK